MSDYRALLKEAYVELKDLRSRLDRAERQQKEPVAIVGMGCRFPGANDPEAFWQLLRDGVDAVSEVPADRWDANAWYDPDPEAAGRMYTRWGGFLSDIAEFDPAFFGISAREAMSMDPQHRLFLEVAWEALENAAIAPDSLYGSRTGVFLGLCTNDYSQEFQQTDGTDQYMATGNTYSVAAGRLSYVLGLQGPTLSLDTACSSSLVAVHLACRGLRAGECRAAIAGGVNAILSPNSTLALSAIRALSPKGRCHTFDAAADGYVRGEGCGVVVLKLLSDALADNDRILAVIRGSDVNHDGRSGGLTAPNGPAQEAVIRNALADAGVEPRQVGYVEAHGTGTSLGDPIELRALAGAFGEARARPLAVGSVKTNIGHLEGAAGVAGLIKVVLLLQHRTIPPNLHFVNPNPRLEWESLPLAIPTRLTEFEAVDGKRVAATSSFGFSGTNAHVVIEEAPARKDDAAGPRGGVHALALSAKTAQALDELKRRYIHFLEQTEESFADFCYTANTGRSHFTHRVAIVAGDCAEAVVKLRTAVATVAENSAAPVTAEAYRDSAEIARLYLAGAAIDWKVLYRAFTFRKLTLPTYPFQHRRYWLENGERPLPSSSKLDDVYTIEWHRAPDASNITPERGHFLIAADEHARTLADALAHAGWECTIGGYEEALQLVQKPTAGRLWILTRGAQAVAGSVAAPDQATLWGLARVIALEHPELWGGIADLDPSAPVSEPVCEADAVLRALASSREEKEFALRANERWLPRLVALKNAPGALNIRKDGTYVITGGAGGIGQLVARWLAARGAQHIVLLSRSPVQGLPFESRIADISSKADVERAFAEIRATTPPVRGVFHLAGVLDDGLLSDQSASRFATVMAPKVAGTWNLHRATRGDNLDLFVLFSSATAVLGSPGQGNYAVANAFPDAFASFRRSLGLPALSIGWGPWRETGMAAGIGNTRFAAMGIEPFAPGDALQLLSRVANFSVPYILAARINWQTLMRRAVRPLIADLAPVEKRSASHLPLPEYLRQAIHRLLATNEEIADDRNLIELGLDSLMVMELVNELKRFYPINVYPRELYAHPTIAGLTDYLLREIRGEHTAELLDSPQRVIAPAKSLERKVPGIVLVLSSPRAGSTLLRVMMAGNPALFCPPELHLLPFDDMKQRSAALQSTFLGEGLTRALMELGVPDADSWTDLEIPEVYRKLHELAGMRPIVDKSPLYAGSLDILARAEAIFENARYIHLVRHPYSVMESFVRNRMSRVVGDSAEDPWRLAERIWLETNRNVTAFFEQVPAERRCRIVYEDLVQSPEAGMRKLCEFLEVPYAPAMLQPYEGRRMTDGVRAQSLSIGDPNFLSHKTIEPALAQVWKSIRLPVELSAATRRVAAELNYELPQEVRTARREETIEIRGMSIRVCHWGPEDGPLVLCLHGILDHGAAWELVALDLARRGFHVVAPDQRGHGRSAHVSPAGGYYLMDFVADADALVKGFGECPITLVGHSMGAAISSLLTSARPGRIASLILVECLLPPDEAGNAQEELELHLDYLASNTPHPVLPDLATAAKRLRIGSPAMPEDFAARMAERLTEPRDAGVAWRWDPRLRSRAGIALDGMGTLRRARYLDLLAGISAPVTFIYGRESRYTNRRQMEVLQDVLPDSSAMTIPGAHNLHVDSPSDLAEAIAARAHRAGAGESPGVGESLGAALLAEGEA